MSRAAITRYTVDTGKQLTEPIRIAHVSDLHERNSDDVLSMLKAEKPDLIMVTGDTFERYDNRPQYEFYRRPVKRLIINVIHYSNYILTKFEPKRLKADEENVLRFLSEAVKTAPVYMGLGNHEQKLLYRDYVFLKKQGIILLDNADTVVELKGLRFLLGGMSCWDFEEWFPTFLEKDGYKILLCHKPNQYMDFVKGKGVDLTLSGHTHGGQMLIGRKGMGFFVPGQGLFGKYAHGSFCDGRLIVSAGCANTVAFPRIFNPRELVMITLK